jgi:predicted amidohydrolase
MWGRTSLSIVAAEIARESGTTTFIDAGSSCRSNFNDFRRHVIAAH